jgi:hypothetical protein
MLAARPPPPAPPLTLRPSRRPPCHSTTVDGQQPEGAAIEDDSFNTFFTETGE